MKPFCIPTHCPFCQKELAFIERRENEEGINPLATHLVCRNCVFRHPDNLNVCFQISFHDGELDYILIASPTSLFCLQINFSPRLHMISSMFGKIIIEENGCPDKEHIMDFPYLVPIDLCSKENIESKLKLLATFL